LMRRHGIKQEIWELQDLNPTAKIDYEVARELRQQRAFYPAILRYEKVLALNPNHISTIFELAECLLATQASSRAIVIFERAYQIDPFRAQDGLLRAQLDYAKLLVDRDQLIEAEQSLTAVEALDEQSESAKRLRQIIHAKRQTPAKRTPSWGRFITDLRWSLLGGPPKSPAPPHPIDPDDAPSG
jgi:tetratricopeptide (TPR) repeat protein